MTKHEVIDLIKLALPMAVLGVLGRHFPDWIALAFLGIVILLTAYSASTKPR